MADFILPNRTPLRHLPTCAAITLRSAHPISTAKRWSVEMLDFRVLAGWDYAGEKLAYLAPATDDHF